MRRIFEQLHRPEYTGENRCWPCTLTNSLLLGTVVGTLLARGRRTAAVAIAAAGVTAIALRGYLVPYTPQFAPSLLAALPISGKPASEPGSLTGSEATAPDGDAVLAELFDAGVVVADGEDIRLDAEFRTEWRAQMRRLRAADLTELARIATETAPPSVTARADRQWGRSVLVIAGDGTSVTLRRPVAVAELAASRALASRTDDPAICRAAGRPLRSLLERCPLCETSLTTTRSTCCGETTPIGETPTTKLFCPSCDERLFVFDE